VIELKGQWPNPPSDSGGGSPLSLNIIKISYLITVTCVWIGRWDLSELVSNCPDVAICG